MARPIVGSRQNRATPGTPTARPTRSPRSGYFRASASGSTTRPSPREISRVLHACTRLQVRAAAARTSVRQHRHAVLLPFAVAHEDLAPLEIDVLHPQLKTLEQPQPGAVQQRHDQPHRAVKLLQHRAHLSRREHHRQPRRALRAARRRRSPRASTRGPLVQEQQRAQRLVLRRRAHALLDGEPSQERPTPPARPSPGMPLAVKDDEPANPVRRTPPRSAGCSGACGCAWRTRSSSLTSIRRRCHRRRHVVESVDTEFALASSTTSRSFSSAGAEPATSARL